MDISALSKDELEKMQMAKEQEYQLSMQNLSTVELQDLELSRKVAELQLQRKSFAVAITQGKYNLRRCASELRVLKTQIWQKLSEGR